MNLTGKAKIAGVMGWPVGHSRSPRLHGYWLAHYRIDGAYVPLAVKPEHLEAALRALPKLGFRGCNLTIPHKEAALNIIDRIEDKARLIGAVNTIVVEADGTLTGSNTDVAGFAENLRENAGVLNISRPALVIGAGGAARAIVAALKELGFGDAILVNRTAERTHQLAQDLAPLGISLHGEELGEIAKPIAQASLIVNATSLGMTGQPVLDLDLSGAQSDMVVTDIVYTPLETPLLAVARRRGLKTVDGLGMLLHQARPGFRAWFGVDPQVTGELRAHVLKD